jgi:iron complex transport system substrate-binding protein
MTRTRAARTAAIAVLLPLLAACGGGAADSGAGAASPSRSVSAAPTDAPGAHGSEAAYPLTISTDAGDVTLDDQPRSIVSLSPTATEMLFAVGAGDQVAAVDSFSNFPPDAPTTDLSAFEPNVEAIAGYEPDLVVIADDGTDLSSALGELDIPVLVHPAAATLDDTYAQMEDLGEATGHPDEAGTAVERLRSDIEELAADAPETDAPLTYYHELDDTYYSVTTDTFIGQLYELAGLRSIADRADGDAGGYPQLSEEFIVDADPDLIFLADTKCCGQTAETVAERPGWDQLTAVRQGAVVELDDDIASRWGPRVVDLLGTVVDAVEQRAGTDGS